MNASDWGLLVIAVSFLGWFGQRLWVACERSNRADWGNAWLNRLDGLNRLFCRWYHRLEPATVALPAQGATVVVANHVSGLDPLLILAACDRPLRFVIAREQYERFGLHWLFRALRLIPVDRERSPEKALFAARAALQQGDFIAIFPHGGIYPPNPPPPVKRGAAFLASLVAAPIAPLRLEGVRGEGHTVLAVLMASRAKVHAGTLLQCRREQIGECLGQIESFFAKT
jgi:1-acyl-sn-glycerol-3-phosphate acyltransferase